MTDKTGCPKRTPSKWSVVLERTTFSENALETFESNFNNFIAVSAVSAIIRKPISTPHICFLCDRYLRAGI